MFIIVLFRNLFSLEIQMLTSFLHLISIVQKFYTNIFFYHQQQFLLASTHLQCLCYCSRERWCPLPAHRSTRQHRAPWALEARVSRSSCLPDTGRTLRSPQGWWHCWMFPKGTGSSCSHWHQGRRLPRGNHPGGPRWRSSSEADTHHILRRQSRSWRYLNRVNTMSIPRVCKIACQFHILQT